MTNRSTGLAPIVAWCSRNMVCSRGSPCVGTSSRQLRVPATILNFSARPVVERPRALAMCGMHREYLLRLFQVGKVEHLSIQPNSSAVRRCREGGEHTTRESNLLFGRYEALIDDRNLIRM